MASTIIARKLPRQDDNIIRLVAATPYDQELLHSIPAERDIKLVVTVPRNLKFHKKFFALLGVIIDYMDERTRLDLNVHTTEELLNRLKIDLGLYTLFIVGPGSTLPEGTPIYQPDSISFDKMDEVAFHQLYKNTISIAIGKYTTAQTEASMMEAVDAVLRFE